jgi:hypothetical protein
LTSSTSSSRRIIIQNQKKIDKCTDKSARAGEDLNNFPPVCG